jgi:hypothetical protein
VREVARLLADLLRYADSPEEQQKLERFAAEDLRGLLERGSGRAGEFEGRLTAPTVADHVPLPPNARSAPPIEFEIGTGSTALPSPRGWAHQPPSEPSTVTWKGSSRFGSMLRSTRQPWAKANPHRQVERMTSVQWALSADPQDFVPWDPINLVFWGGSLRPARRRAPEGGLRPAVDRYRPAVREAVRLHGGQRRRGSGCRCRFWQAGPALPPAAL